MDFFYSDIYIQVQLRVSRFKKFVYLIFISLFKSNFFSSSINSSMFDWDAGHSPKLGELSYIRDWLVVIKVHWFISWIPILSIELIVNFMIILWLSILSILIHILSMIWIDFISFYHAFIILINICLGIVCWFNIIVFVGQYIVWCIMLSVII